MALLTALNRLHNVLLFVVDHGKDTALAQLLIPLALKIAV